jgi:hypothetical protein
MLPWRLCETRLRAGAYLGLTEAATAVVVVEEMVESGAVSKFELEVVGITKSAGRRSATEQRRRIACCESMSINL